MPARGVWRRRDLGLALGAASLGPAWAQAPRRLLLVNAPYPPFVMEAGDPEGEGMDVEIARQALEPAGYELGLQLFPWRRALAMLEQGAADLTTTLSLSGDRQRFLRYSVGYRHEVRYHFYSRTGGPLVLESAEQLKRLRLGLTAGFFYPAPLKAAARIEEGRDLRTGINMLLADRVDLIAANHLAGAYTIRKLGVAERLQRQPFSYSSGSPTHMALSRARHGGNDALLDALDQGLKRLAKDGSLRRIEQRYVEGLPR